jgi:hypothetical protein
MTEQPLHPDHELVELALGELGEPYRTPLIRHLVSCTQCRADYDDILAAVDATLLAAPEIAPPVGFEQRVLSKIGVLATAKATAEATTAATERPPRRRPRDGLLLAAAAAVLAALAGGITAVTIWGDDAASEPVLTAHSAALRTGDGEVVGTAALSSVDDKPVVVVSIADPPIGVPYHCRVMLDSGRTVDSKSWTDETSGGSTWIVPVPEGHIVNLEVVTDDGRVWSSAQMP